MNKNLKQFYLNKLLCETVGHYAVLGLGPNATPDEIKAAYRRAVMATHPDRFPGSEDHERVFKEVSAANEVLSDPDRRSTYDRDLDLQILSGIDSSGWRQREVPSPAHTKLPKYEPPQQKPAAPAAKTEPRATAGNAGQRQTPAREQPAAPQQTQPTEPAKEQPAAPQQTQPTGPELDPTDWEQFSGVRSGKSERTLDSVGYVPPRNIRAQRAREALDALQARLETGERLAPGESERAFTLSTDPFGLARDDVGPRRSQAGSGPRDVGSSGFGQVQNPSGPLTPEQNRGVSRGFTERPIQERYISSLRRMIEASQDANEKAKMVADQIASTMRTHGATPEEIERMRQSGAPQRLASGNDGNKSQKQASTKKPSGDSRYKR